MATLGRSCFLPPYLLRRLAEARPERADRAVRTLALDEVLRARRPDGPAAPSSAAAGPAWVVHTADGGTDLPGTPVRRAGEPEVGDAAVDEAAAGVTGALALFEEVYGRSSYDDRGATVSVTVHYGQAYANAFWDGRQLVFGDGDGEVFERFTKPVDVLGHELAHAVTEHTAGLVYRDQPGALNESVSDVYAACLEQRLRGQTAAEADWLIGSELFRPGVRARGLRDMAAPGTAYDDPVLGRDPQVGHLDDYVVTDDDNGGVHLNSGIPNRAFHLAAVAIGGSSAEGAGRIWYAALTGGAVGPRSGFAEFAAATIAAAGDHQAAVREAWSQVGVEPGEATGGPAPRSRPRSGSRVAVRRTGGFAGRTVAAELDLDSDDPRVGEVRGLVERADLAAARGGRPMPDRFAFEFDLCGATALVQEQDLSAELRRIADLVLGDPRL